MSKNFVIPLALLLLGGLAVAVTVKMAPSPVQFGSGKGGANPCGLAKNNPCAAQVRNPCAPLVRNPCAPRAQNPCSAVR